MNVPDGCDKACMTCGPEIGLALFLTVKKVKAKLATFDPALMFKQVTKHPSIMIDFPTWDILGMTQLEMAGPCFSLRKGSVCATCVTVGGKKQDIFEVNYLLLGMLMEAALIGPKLMNQLVFDHKLGKWILGLETNPCRAKWQFTKGMRYWLNQGYFEVPKGRIGLFTPPTSDNARFSCCRKCNSPKKLNKAFQYRLFKGWGGENGWQPNPSDTD